VLQSSTSQIYEPSPALRIWRVPLVLLLLASFLLGNVWWLTMHPDENLSYVSTDGDLVYVFRWQMTLQDNQAPAWFVTFWAWRQWMGDTELASRMLSLSLVLLALAIAYRVGRRALRSEGAACIGLFTLVGHSFFFEYAFDIRPYPMVMLVTMLSLWMFQRWLTQPNGRRTLLYGVSIALMVYVHYLLALFVAIQGAYLLLTRGLDWLRMRQIVLAGVIAALLFAPWFPTFVAHVRHLQNVEQESGTVRGIAGIGVSTFATTPETINAYVEMATAGVPAFYAVILVVGVALRWREEGWWLLVAGGIGVPVVYLALNLVAAVYAPRFISYATIPLALAVGGVLWALPRVRGVPLGMSVLVVLVAAQAWAFSSQLPVRIPYRDIFRAMSSSQDTVVYIEPRTSVDGYLRQQIALYMPPALATTVTQNPNDVDSARRVWFLTGDWFGEGVQDAFRAVETTHPLQQVIGQCDRDWCFLAQLMEAPPNAEAVYFGGELGFRGADTSLRDDALHVRLWWQNVAPIPLDYSISLQALDASGTLVAQSDGQIDDYGREIVSTSQMQPGRIYVDERSIMLPAGTSGEVRLQLLVYQSWDDRRLMLDDGRETIDLGVVNSEE
jgi:hypothetical protein